MSEFRAAIRALLTVEGLSPLPLLGVWHAYANNDTWLFALSDHEFDQFMGFMDILYEGLK